MSVMMLRSRVRPECVAGLEASVGRVFAALARICPAGVRYASSRLGDGVTYLVLLEIEDGVENPLPAIPEFREFQEGLRGWVAEPPETERMTVVGSYRLF
ncbi:MAG TPA: hypothetical protein VIA06_19730 [Candidatus Dormibacteraeota bacterium]|jgi:hypothetical protein|nr:hypothetical protein [Candidatus Dormibacteraeota bacterium]